MKPTRPGSSRGGRMMRVGGTVLCLLTVLTTLLTVLYCYYATPFPLVTVHYKNTLLRILRYRTNIF